MLERTSQKSFTFVRLRLDVDDICGLVALRDKQYPGREKAENLGKGLVAQQVWGKLRVREFVSAVYLWSRNVRNLNRVLDANSDYPAKLLDASLRIVDGDGSSTAAAKAIWALSAMQHMRPSYASKLLRFLHPDKVVIFDSTVRLGMGLQDTEEGYKQFHNNCRIILSGSDASNSFSLSDVEAAIFMKLRGNF